MGAGRRLEPQSNRNACFARPAAERLHEAAVSYLLQPRVGGLANRRSYENRPSAEGEVENRQSGKVNRIAVSYDGAFPGYDCARL